MRKLVSILSALTLAGGVVLAGLGGATALAGEAHTHCVTTTTSPGSSTADCTTTTPDEPRGHDNRRVCASRGVTVGFLCGGVLDDLDFSGDDNGQAE